MRIYAITLLLILFPVSLIAAAHAQNGEDVAVKDMSPKLTLVSEDGQNSITFGLTVQLMYQYYHQDQGVGAPDNYDSEILFRRIRPTVRGSIFGGQVGYYLHLSTTPGSLELMDFYIDYNMAPMMRFRIGQSKIPFTRYRIQSFKNLQFAEWSIVSRYFGAERQLGFCIHNGYEKPQRVEYEIGLYTGKNSRKSHAVGLAETTGEYVGNPSSLIDPEPQDEFHPALAAHIAYNHNGIQTAYDTDFEKSGFRFAAGASTVWDANPVMHRDFALRVAPEILMKAYGIALGGTYYFAWYERPEAADENDIGVYERDGEMADMEFGLTGAVIQASYLVGKSVEVGTRYSYIGTTQNLRKDAQIRAEQILLDAEKDEYDDLADQYSNAGLIRTEREYVFGVNFYFIERILKFQNDFSWIQKEAFDGENLDDFRYRSQLQLAF